MTLQSWLPQAQQNLFQEMKEKREQVEASGVKVLNLAIGQPTGPALLSARAAAAEAVMSTQESMHEYQDNGEPGVQDFSYGFVHAHLKTGLYGANVDYLPIPGIKPMLGLIPLACGSNTRSVIVATTTSPGYPTPADWCYYLGIRHHALRLNTKNQFRCRLGGLGNAIHLVMLNYPHNPSGQIATREWLQEICEYCERYNIRLFNDAAYVALSHATESCALADVAPDFPNLSWAEAYSASKLIGNGTGWRVGAMVGSPDFIGDIKTIKGNTDSGFVAFAAVGVLEAIRNDRTGIQQVRRMYERRLQTLIPILQEQGMKLAVEPKAGFYTLWRAPKQAFGGTVTSAKEFNFMMLERTGVMGIPFTGGSGGHDEQYVRYTVCDDVESMAGELQEAFRMANIVSWPNQ